MTAAIGTEIVASLVALLFALRVRAWLRPPKLSFWYRTDNRRLSSEPDRAFVKAFVVAWDELIAGAARTPREVHRNLPRFNSEIVRLLERDPEWALSYAIFYVVRPVWWAVPTNVPLGRALGKICAECPTLTIKGESHYYAGDLHAWFEAHKKSFRSNDTYRKWRETIGVALVAMPTWRSSWLNTHDTEKVRVSEGSDHEVIVVHGTFAANDEDVGPAWWQEGSAFAQRLRKALGSSVKVSTWRFHWDGRNSESSRFEAAMRLLMRMWENEQAHKPFHVIAHSHGGSLVWTALVLSLIGPASPRGTFHFGPRLGLRYLRSWTTVGTPFIHVSGGRPGPSHIALVTSAIGTTLKILRWAIAALVILAVVHPQPFLGIRPVVGTIVVLTAGLALSAALALLAPLEDSSFIRAEGHFAQAAAAHYGSRWLGLWTKYDEAISGLGIAARTNTTIVPRIGPPRTPLFSGEVRFRRQSGFLRFPYLVLRSCYRAIGNRVFAPWADRFVLRQLRKAACGADRPGTTIRAVLPYPHASLAEALEMPEEIGNQLATAANVAAAKRLPEIRSALAQLSSGELVSLDSPFAFASEELVHTSYFDNEFVSGAIASHVALMGRRDIVGLRGQLDQCSVSLDWVEKVEATRQRMVEQATRAWMSTRWSLDDYA